MAIFELYSTPTNQYRWRLKTEEVNGDTFADSGKGYSSKDQALESIDLLRSVAAGGPLVDLTDGSSADTPLSGGYFELYRDRGLRFRWRIKFKEALKKARLISDATHGLATKEVALKDIRMVRNLAQAATLLDETLEDDPDPAVPYNLGTLPPELTIRWPAPPQIEQTVEISTAPEDGTMRAEQTRTRFIIAANLERLNLAASDIEVQVNEGVFIGKLFIARASKRLRITGGGFGSIEVETLTDYNSTPPVSNEAWMVEDLLLNNVQVTTVVPEDRSADDNENTFSAFYLRGKRIALLNSRVQAFHYSVWVWANTDTSDFSCEDIILAGNVFESAGPEATVRLVSVQRSVVVDNRFINVGIPSPTGEITHKHNYRVHGRSDLNFAARNTLIKSGLMMGTMAGDDLGTVWFQESFIYLLTRSLLESAIVDIDRFQFSNNVIFAEEWDHDQILSEIPEQWLFENNYIRKLLS